MSEALAGYGLAPVYLPRPERAAGDRLELLTALINGPRFDPLLRGTLLEFPPGHAVVGWTCAVNDCPRPRGQRYGNDLCGEHSQQWTHRADGVSRAQFLVAAAPLGPRPQPRHRPGCRLCPQRPSTGTDTCLCRRHQRRWERSRWERPGLDWEEWLAGEMAFPGFGECAVSSCTILSCTPRQLCWWHETAYRHAGRPGGVELPGTWLRDYDSRNRPTPVTVGDPAAFRRWCVLAPSPYLPGQLNLRGLRPLARAEIAWGLFKHTEGDRAKWLLCWIQSMINAAREQEANSLVDLTGHTLAPHPRRIVKEMLGELRLIYFTPADTREAGYLDTDHFGVRFPDRASYFSLAGITQRWLRDLAWDHLAGRLRSPDCPRSGSPFDGLRRGCVELSAFLETDAPEHGHDPALLREEHMHRFVADQRHRERHQLPSLGVHREDGRTSTVTPAIRKNVLDAVRKLLRTALEDGHAERLGLDRRFIVAAPAGGGQTSTPRRPFPDDVARALAEEANLHRLAEHYDPNDHGLRDIWEVLIVTGRRISEARLLRLDCVTRHQGLPLLWHDQTKVGNYDAAIRIPEVLYERLLERRRKTLARFVEGHGRYPDSAERAAMALFPRIWRNPSATQAMSYAWFGQHFRAWVDELDIGHYVSHQARHTMATNLLRNGAGLHHIRRYLGHVSERMSEHYIKIAMTDLDDVLNSVWVTGPGAAQPGEVLSTGATGMTREQAQALALDLSRRSTPAEGGFCTFQPVVAGGACPFNLDCHNCDKFVLSGADLLYWRRKREQWTSIAERAPDDTTADYLHQVFAPTARAIDGLEKALAGIGLLDDALAMDLRGPQDYFQRIWATAFRATDLATHHDAEDPAATGGQDLVEDIG
ncbi:MAG: site-specific integrase [Pseudonocardia sp.]|nr:site-specific integrase [Pseudonocardia sp.]